jgi:hypothetical protein
VLLSGRDTSISGHQLARVLALPAKGREESRWCELHISVILDAEVFLEMKSSAVVIWSDGQDSAALSRRLWTHEDDARNRAFCDGNFPVGIRG